VEPGTGFVEIPINFDAAPTFAGILNVTASRLISAVSSKNIDEEEIRGSLSLASGSDGFNLAEEDFTFTIQSQGDTIPKGSFRQAGIDLPVLKMRKKLK